MATKPKVTFFEGKSWIGGIVTLIFFVIGLYLISKHSKAVGFWWGFFAMFFLASYLYINKNGFEFRFGFMSLEVDYTKENPTPPLYEIKDGKCIKTTFLPIEEGVMYVTAPTEQTEVEMCKCDKTC